MHPTSAFRHDDPAFRDSMIRDIGFAAIFLTTPDGPRVGHTPVELTEDHKLRFHLARSNALVPHIDGATVLAVAHGPYAYMSARWYQAANQVPTWNYIAFEMEGRVARMDDSELPGLLDKLSRHYEARVQHGTAWTMDKMEPKALAALLKGIVGFEMTIDAFRETVKLSQNKPAAERGRLIAGLDSEGHHQLASLMRRFA